MEREGWGAWSQGGNGDVTTGGNPNKCVRICIHSLHAVCVFH